MTSARKHVYRSQRSNPHFHKIHKITLSKWRSDALNIDAIAAAITRRPAWFWNFISYIKKAVSGFRKQDRG